MKNVLLATFLAGAFLCAASIAQTAPSAQNPSAPPSQPEAQPNTSQSATTPAPQSQQPPQQAQPGTSARASANQEQAAGPRRIAPGSVIPVQLTKTIDAKKAKAGDEVVAKVTMDLKTNSGEVIVPKDTKVTGHITEAQARNKEQKESQVAIAFDHAMLKDGEMSLPMSIQAVIAPPSNNSNNAGGNDQGTPTPASTGTTASSPMGSGRTSATGGGGQTQPSNTAPNAVGTTGTGTSQEGSARPQINGNTQGVVGISNLKLESAQTGAQGSVLTSDKNNVKVESGTLLLLRVNQ